LLCGYSELARADLVKSIEQLQPKAKTSAVPPAPEKELPKVEAAKTFKKPIHPARKNQQAKTSAEQKKEKELTFASDFLMGSQKSGLAELQGNVRIHHGDLFLRSEKAQMLFDDKTKELSRVIAIGAVVLERNGEKPSEVVYASGGKMEYDRINNMVFLTQNALLKQGSDIVRGELIKYNVATGIVEVQRVQGNVTPSPKDAEQGKPREE
jgi:lipopolysaccharide transport protein LptA